MFLEALVRRLVIALGILLSVLGLGGAAASAADDVAPVDVLQVDGLLDHVVANEITLGVGGGVNIIVAPNCRHRSEIW